MITELKNALFLFPTEKAYKFEDEKAGKKEGISYKVTFADIENQKILICRCNKEEFERFKKMNVATKGTLVVEVSEFNGKMQLNYKNFGETK